MISTNTGVLLLHGFAGCPEEVKPLGDYLTEMGYLVECPLLPGHGKAKKDLSKSTRKDWIAAAEQAYLALAKKCDRIYVVGFSMGGLLAVNLWNYGFAGMVTVNTPVYYWNLKIVASNLLSDFRRYGKKYLAAAMDKSLFSLLQFLKLLSDTKPMLGYITSRTMVVQALDDDTVHYKSADFILKKIRADKSVYRLPHGGHMIFQSDSGREVCRAIGRFIQTAD